MSGQFGQVMDTVMERQDQFSGYVKEAMNTYAGQALSAIGTLKTVGGFVQRAGQVPYFYEPVLPNVTGPRLAAAPTKPAKPDVSDPTAGVGIGSEVSDAVRSALDAVTVPSVPVPVLPAAPSISFPAAPALSAIADPGNAPALTTVDVPTAPALSSPAVPMLEDIVIPTFVFPTLPDFDASAPAYSKPAEYSMVVDESGQATVSYDGRVMYKGGRYDLLGAQGKALFSKVYDDMQSIIDVRGTGISPAIEQAMFDSAKAREDQVTTAEVQAVISRFASRGFYMPSGVMDAAIQDVRDKGALQSRSLSRDVMLKRADQELDMLKFVMGQAVAAEQFMFAVYESTAKQRLDILQATNNINAQLVDSGVKVFNAQASLVQLQADIWRTRIESELKKVDMFKAELEAAQAKGQLNEQKVRVYTAMYEGVKAEVSLYTARLSGVQSQLQVQQSRIDGYRATVQAYSERQQAERYKMQTFTDQVNAERSKVDIYDAQARVYLGQLDAVLRASDIGIKKAESLASAKGGDVRAYEAKLGAATAKMQAEVSELKAVNEQYLAELDAMSKLNDSETTRFRSELELRVSTLRSSLESFTARVQAYGIEVNALAEADKTITAAASAAGDLGAKVAMGALSAFNVSAGMGVSGSTTDDSAQK